MLTNEAASSKLFAFFRISTITSCSLLSANTGTKGALRQLPISMKIPLVTLAIICIILGILPQVGIAIAQFVESNIASAAYVEGVLGIVR